MARILFSLCIPLLLTTATQANDPLLFTSGLNVKSKVVLRDVCVCSRDCGMHSGEYVLVAGDVAPEWLGEDAAELAYRRALAEVEVVERSLFQRSKATKEKQDSMPESERLALIGRLKAAQADAEQAHRIASRPKVWTITVVNPGVLGLEAETEDGTMQMFIPLNRVRAVVRLPAKLSSGVKPGPSSN